MGLIHYSYIIKGKLVLSQTEQRDKLNWLQVPFSQNKPVFSLEPGPSSHSSATGVLGAGENQRCHLLLNVDWFRIERVFFCVVVGRLHDRGLQPMILKFAFEGCAQVISINCKTMFKCRFLEDLVPVQVPTKSCWDTGSVTLGISCFWLGLFDLAALKSTTICPCCWKHHLPSYRQALIFHT